MAKADNVPAPAAEQTMMEKVTEWFNSMFGSAKQTSKEVADKAKELSQPIQESAASVIQSTKQATEEAIAKGKSLAGVDAAPAATQKPKTVEQKSNASTAVVVFVGVVAAVIVAQTAFIVYTSTKGSKRDGGDAKPAAPEAAPAAQARSLPEPASAPAAAAAAAPAPAAAAAADDRDEL